MQRWRARYLAVFVALTFVVAALGLTTGRPSEAGDDELLVCRWTLSRSRYSSVVKFAELEAMPKWKAVDPNPPISSRRAIKLAREMLAKKLGFVDKKTFIWAPKEASLIRLMFSDDSELWYWRIAFEESGHGLSGPPQRLEAAVLMNGRAVIPTISKIAPDDRDE